MQMKTYSHDRVQIEKKGLPYMGAKTPDYRLIISYRKLVSQHILIRTDIFQFLLYSAAYPPNPERHPVHI